MLLLRDNSCCLLTCFLCIFHITAVCSVASNCDPATEVDDDDSVKINSDDFRSKHCMIFKTDYDKKLCIKFLDTNIEETDLKLFDSTIEDEKYEMKMHNFNIFSDICTQGSHLMVVMKQQPSRSSYEFEITSKDKFITVSRNSRIPIALLVGSCIVSVFILVILMVVCVCCCRRRQHPGQVLQRQPPTGTVIRTQQSSTIPGRPILYPAQPTAPLLPPSEMPPPPPLPTAMYPPPPPYSASQPYTVSQPYPVQPVYDAESTQPRFDIAATQQNASSHEAPYPSAPPMPP